MTQNTKNVGILLIIIVVIGSIYYSNNKKSSENNTNIATTTVATSTTSTKNTTVTKTTTNTVIPKTKDIYPSSYANNEYLFQIRFPSYVKVQNYFTTFYNLSSNWRLNPSYANQGKAIVALPIFKIDQGQYASSKSTYPLYYTTEVRVSVSLNTQDCYAIESGYKSDGSVVINNVTFKKFSYNDNLSPNYTIGESYRTVNNNKCFVLEQIKSGSSLKNTDMQIGTTDATLTAYYNVGESIIKTFKFTK